MRAQGVLDEAQRPARFAPMGGPRVAPRVHRGALVEATGPQDGGMGVEAVDLPRPLRPGAGQSHTALRWVCQDWRSSARGCWGSGIERSFAPVPSRTCTSRRALSMSGPCRGVPSWSRRPQAEMGRRQARSRGNRPPWRSVGPSSRRRMTGSVGSWGGRTKVRVVHARLRGCS